MPNVAERLGKKQVPSYRKVLRELVNRDRDRDQKVGREANSPVSRQNINTVVINHNGGSDHHQCA
jgi:hypothetical protein